MTRSIHSLTHPFATHPALTGVDPRIEETGDPILMLSATGLIILALVVLGRVITSRL